MTRAAALLLLAVAGCAQIATIAPIRDLTVRKATREEAAASRSALPPPSTSVTLGWTLPDSVVGRWDCRPDTTARSWMSTQVWWVGRFGPPHWPPVWRDSLLLVIPEARHDTVMGRTVETPGHGAIYVRACNEYGGCGCWSNLVRGRISE